MGSLGPSPCQTGPSKRLAASSWGGPLLLVLMGTLPAVGWGFEAVRVSEPPRVDGKLDEAAWRQAPAFSGFHQSFPEPGAPPSQRTEARVLYDDGNLYVGVRCFDHQPHAIRAQLGRRDRLPASDVVWVMIDSLHDRLSGTAFAVNAGGTLSDARLFQDTERDDSWDGVWEGAATRDGQGWSAELRIPLELLHFPKAQEQRWGFHVRRVIARTHEQLDSVPLPPEVNALVSRFAELRGLRGLRKPRRLALTPFIATRLSRRPLPRPDGPRLMEPSADIGLDAWAGLTSTLSLSLTLNPEFGQVEADEFVVNLTRLETRLTEKRPFFLEGLELFEPAVGDAPDEQTPFYSRRLGQEAPLLAAVKLSGATSERLQLSVLDALVAGVPNPSPSLPPDHRVQLHPWRPLHLAPNFSLPSRVPPPTNFFASAVRLQVSEGTTLGATTTLATPLSSACGLGVPLEGDEEDCEPRGGRAVALDASLRSPSGDYTLAAQVAGSQVTGGPASGELLLDGTLLRDGSTGLGLQLSGGKLGGEPWRLTTSYSYASPQLELNPTGYQPVNNEQVLELIPEYVHTGWAGLPEVAVGLDLLARWSTDERTVPLGSMLELFAYVVLPDFTQGNCRAGLELGRKDLRELEQVGVAFQRPSFAFADCTLSTNRSRPLALVAEVYVHRLLNLPATRERTGQRLLLSVTWQPLPRLQTSLGATYQNDVDGPRWVEETEAGLHLFGDLTPRFVTFTFRQLVVLTPTLTLQAFAQVLGGLERYERFYEGRAERGGLLRLADLLPTTREDDPGTHIAALNLNVVLRWEYKLGSTLFVVYTRSQSALPAEGDPPSPTVLPRGLLGGPHTDSLLVKLGYWW